MHEYIEEEENQEKGIEKIFLFLRKLQGKRTIPPPSLHQLKPFRKLIALKWRETGMSNRLLETREMIPSDCLYSEFEIDVDKVWDTGILMGIIHFHILHLLGFLGTFPYILILRRPLLTTGFTELLSNNL